MVGGTNNIQQTNETNNSDAKEKIQRGWKKIDHATKELIESDPNKNLIIVETINSPSCDEEKRSVSLSTLKRLAISREQMKIVGIAKTTDEYDFRNVRVHLNESGVTKLVEHKWIYERTFLERNHKRRAGFLANRPYQGVTREYAFGGKVCSEIHSEEKQCSPGNKQPQESAKRGPEFLTPLKGSDAKKFQK